MYHYYYDKYAVSMPPAARQLGKDTVNRIADFLRAHPIGSASTVGAAGLGLGHLVGYKSGRAVQRFEDVWDAGTRVLNNKQASYTDMSPYLAYAMYGDKTAAPIGTMLKAGFNAIKGFGSKLAPQAKNMVNAAKGFGKEAGTLGKGAFGEAKTLAKTGWNKMQPGMKNLGNNLKTGLKQFGNEAKDVAMGNRGLVAQSALLGGAGAGLGMAGKSMFGDSRAAYSFVNPYWFGDKTAGAGAYVGGYGKGSDNAFPSALGLATAGPSASSADYVYRKRRAEGRGRLKALANSYGNAALGTLNGAVTGGLGGALLGGGIGAAIGGPAGGYVGAQLLGNLGGFGGAMAGAPNQLSLASDNSPLVHLLPTLGGAGIGGLAGAIYGDRKGENQLAYTGLGAGLGGLAGYGLSRLMN